MKDMDYFKKKLIELAVEAEEEGCSFIGGIHVDGKLHSEIGGQYSVGVAMAGLIQLDALRECLRARTTRKT